MGISPMVAIGVGLALAEERRAVERAYRSILEATLGRDLTPGTRETPARAAKAWAELMSGYDVDIPALFKQFDSEGYDEMISAIGLPFTSTCEHHLMPFTGLGHIVYIPNEDTKQVMGLSKLPRLLDAYARRLQQQERIGMQIADALVGHAGAKGVLIVLDCHHSCMSCRGIKSQGRMRTSVTRGAMRENPETRAEAFALIGSL